MCHSDQASRELISLPLRPQLPASPRSDRGAPTRLRDDLDDPPVTTDAPSYRQRRHLHDRHLHDSVLYRPAQLARKVVRGDTPTGQFGQG